MKERVNLAVIWMMKYDGRGFLTGGLERWCRDIAFFLKDKGYEVHIYQKANERFEKSLADDITVHGIQAPLRFVGNRQLTRWLKKNLDPNDPILFVSQELALSTNFTKSVTVNHGVWFDGDMPLIKKWMNKVIQKRLILNARATLCVDTNYINWCHTELKGRKEWLSKLHFIPNYADPSDFEIKNDTPKADIRSLRLLFPRRLNGHKLDMHPRGAGLFMQCIQVLRERGYDPFVEFTGRGELQEVVIAKARAQGWEDRITVNEVSFEEMPKAYQRADVVVIPTVAHEGTSLSAIEAIMTGRPTVVTHIGGLGNVVLDGVNAYICDLTPQSMADSIERAYQEHCLQNTEVHRQFRKAFSMERWQRSVWQILQKALELEDKAQ